MVVPSNLMFAVGIVAVGFFLVVLVGPLVAHSRLRRVRTPTKPDQRHLDDLVKGTGIHVDRARVVETVGESSIEVSVRGPPGYRVLFVTDFVLSELDESTARALVAAESGRQAVWYDEYRALSATVAVVLGAAWFGGILEYSAGLAALGAVALVLLAGGRWLQFRADAHAANAIGAEEVADAFETVATMHGTSLEAPGWRGYFEVQPPLWSRIQRLRERS